MPSYKFPSPDPFRPVCDSTGGPNKAKHYFYGRYFCTVRAQISLIEKHRAAPSPEYKSSSYIFRYIGIHEVGQPSRSIREPIAGTGYFCDMPFVIGKFY